MAIGSIVNGLSESTVKSASFPTEIVPTSPSRLRRLGDRVRVVCTLTDVREHSKGVLLTTHNVMELEDSDRPCLVADWVVLLRSADSL